MPAQALVCDLKVAPDGSYVLVATNQGVFRSGDEGRTWQACTAGLPHNSAQRLAVSARRPQVVYCTMATTARDGAPFNGGVYRSEDGGKTWRARCNGLGSRVGKSGESAAMTSNYSQIAIDPRDDTVVYAGDRAWVTAGIYKTADAGEHWSRVTDHFSAKKNMDYGWITQWGPSVECLALSPADPSRVVFGTSGHVFVSGNGGLSWNQRYCRQFPDGRFASNGLAVTCALGAYPDRDRPQRWYFGFMDIGLLVSDDAGGTFRTSYAGLKDAGNCFALAADPADPRKLWVATGQWARNEGYVSRSEDGGASWALVGQPSSGLPCGQVRSLLVDPASPPGKRVLYATLQRLRCLPQHGRWSELAGGRRGLAGGGPPPARVAC